MPDPKHIPVEKPDDDTREMPSEGPAVIRITPEGRREVDPMSIIRDKSVITQLERIRGRSLVIKKAPA